MPERFRHRVAGTVSCRAFRATALREGFRLLYRPTDNDGKPASVFGWSLQDPIVTNYHIRRRQRGVRDRSPFFVEFHRDQTGVPRSTAGGEGATKGSRKGLEPVFGPHPRPRNRVACLMTQQPFLRCSINSSESFFCGNLPQPILMKTRIVKLQGVKTQVRDIPSRSRRRIHRRDGRVEVVDESSLRTLFNDASTVECGDWRPWPHAEASVLNYGVLILSEFQHLAVFAANTLSAGKLKQISI